MAKSRKEINSDHCRLSCEWDCYHDLNTIKISRKKTRGKIRPTVPRKSKERLRNICQYHDSCQEEYVYQEKETKELKPTEIRDKKPKTFTKSEFHTDLELSSNKLTDVLPTNTKY